MIHIICANPALDRTVSVKRFIENGTTRASSVYEDIGGKGFNVVRALDTVDPIPYKIYTFLGGYYGEILSNLIDQQKISCSTIPINESTRVCNMIYESSNGQVHSVNEPGPVIQKDEIKSFLKKVNNSINEKDFVLISGSLPIISNDFYQQIIKLVEKKKGKVILDTSGDSLKMAMKSNPWFLKINQHEFSEMYNLKSSHDENEIISVLEEFDQNTIVTLGAGGSLARFQNKVYKVSVPKIEALNPTASGDIFLGGLSKGFEKNRSFESCLKLAHAYSLSNCLHETPTIQQDEVNNFYNKIDVSIIKEVV